MINAENEQSKIILKTIVISGALNIFEALYNKDGAIAIKLLKNIIKSDSQEIVSSFRQKLEQIGTDKAKSDAEKLAKYFGVKTEKRILAVDDSKAMLAFYRNIAPALKVELLTAFNGKEALELLEKGEVFNLIITDMNMPVMNGIEFVRKLREHSEFKDIPVVMVSTESDHSQKELAAKAGVNDFIQKPFTNDEIQNKIKKFI
jgi:CheY-like chemotaxis protein